MDVIFCPTAGEIEISFVLRHQCKWWKITKKVKDASWFERTNLSWVTFNMNIWRDSLHIIHQAVCLAGNRGLLCRRSKLPRSGCHLQALVPNTIVSRWIATDWQSPPHRILTNATKARTSDGGFTSVREASLDSEILSIFWNWLEILKLDFECWIDFKKKQ